MSEPISRKYTANLTNSGDHRWLDLIVLGHLKKNGHNVYKTMEGRINKGKWKEMRAGDELLLKEVGDHPKKWVRCLVKARHEKTNFRELAKEYGRFLAPHLKGNVDEIEATYLEIVDQIRQNSPEIDQIIEQNGVVAIEIKVLAYDGFGF